MPEWRNWQTRQTQNLVREISCGFKSLLRYWKTRCFCTAFLLVQGVALNPMLSHDCHDQDGSRRCASRTAPASVHLRQRTLEEGERQIEVACRDGLKDGVVFYD